MPTSSVSHSIVTDRRRLLTVLALLLALGEFVSAFMISFWEAAAVFAILFLAAALWSRRGGIGGPILAGALSAFELESFPTWARGGAGDWILQISVVVLSVAGLLAALAVLKRSYDTRNTKNGLARVEA